MDYKYIPRKILNLFTSPCQFLKAPEPTTSKFRLKVTQSFFKLLFTGKFLVTKWIDRQSNTQEISLRRLSNFVELFVSSAKKVGMALQKSFDVALNSCLWN